MKWRRNKINKANYNEETTTTILQLLRRHAQLTTWRFGKESFTARMSVRNKHIMVNFRHSYKLAGPLDDFLDIDKALDRVLIQLLRQHTQLTTKGSGQ